MTRIAAALLVGTALAMGAGCTTEDTTMTSQRSTVGSGVTPSTVPSGTSNNLARETAPGTTARTVDPATARRNAPSGTSNDLRRPGPRGTSATVGGDTRTVDPATARRNAPSGTSNDLNRPRSTTAGAAGATGAAVSTPDYLRMAGSSDLYEIRASELALERAQSPQVKDFARRMIRDHTTSSQQLSQAQVASATGGSVPPATLTPEHRRMLDQLEQARGAEFDRLYMHQQIQAHQEALALHRNYAQSGQDARVRSTAEEILPVVESHGARLDQMADQQPARPGMRH